MLGPTSVDSMLPSLELSEPLIDYVKQMLTLCDGSEAKAAALQGGLEEYRELQEQRAQRKQLEDESAAFCMPDGIPLKAIA